MHEGGRHSGLISIVLCTSGQRPSVEDCLRSLHALDDDDHEVLVVENAPVPTLGPACERWGARLVHEPRRGLDAARNRGLHEASGGIVAYVDDDCVVDPGWLAAYRRAFEDPATGFATGRVRPRSLARPSERAFERWYRFDRGPRSRCFELDDPWPHMRVLANQLGTGCKMAFRRTVLVEAGGFDEALDMGTLIGGGGDLDAFARLLRAGVRAAYVPEAVVRHAHRTTMRALRWQFFGYGAAQGALAAKGLLGDASLRREALDAHQHRIRTLVHHLRLRRARRARGVGAGLLAVELAGVLAGPLLYPASVLQSLVRRATSPDSSRDSPQRMAMARTRDARFEVRRQG